MGWMCSWVAVKGAAKSELLGALDLVETGEEVEPGSRAAPMCCAERPDGWVVLFSEDFDWADRKRVLELSHLGLTVGCQFEDKVEMTSVASAAQDGVELWRVFHVNNPKSRLDVTGDPPLEFTAIRDQLFREQDEDDADDTDYIHDVPLELAKAVCGYRADEDESVFVGVRSAKGGPGESSSPRPSLLGMIFASFRRR